MTSPITSKSYTATSGQTVFLIPFTYLQDTLVTVKVNGASRTRTVDYTVQLGTLTDGVYSGGSITLVVGSTIGDTVEIIRDSGLLDTNRLVNFAAGARLLESDLDKSSMQLLHLMQEVSNDTTASTVTISDVVGLQSALDSKAGLGVFGTSAATGAVNADGLVPGPSETDVSVGRYLKADGAWGVPAGGGGGSGASTFLELSDTPSAFTGHTDKFVRVSSENPATGLQFTSTIGDLADLNDVSTTLASDGDALVWNTGGGAAEWKPSPSVNTDIGTNANFYTKGDLLVGDGTSFITVPAGSGGTGKVLTQNSSVDSGVVWLPPTGGSGAGGGVLVRSHSAAVGNHPSGRAIAFTTFDYNSCDTLTGGQQAPPVNGQAFQTTGALLVGALGGESLKVEVSVSVYNNSTTDGTYQLHLWDGPYESPSEYLPHCTVSIPQGKTGYLSVAYAKSFNNNDVIFATLKSAPSGAIIYIQANAANIIATEIAS